MELNSNEFRKWFYDNENNFYKYDSAEDVEENKRLWSLLFNKTFLGTLQFDEVSIMHNMLNSAYGKDYGGIASLLREYSDRRRTDEIPAIASMELLKNSTARLDPRKFVIFLLNDVKNIKSNKYKEGLLEVAQEIYKDCDLDKIFLPIMHYPQGGIPTVSTISVKEVLGKGFGKTSKQLFSNQEITDFFNAFGDFADIYSIMDHANVGNALDFFAERYQKDSKQMASYNLSRLLSFSEIRRHINDEKFAFVISYKILKTIENNKFPKEVEEAAEKDYGIIKSILAALNRCVDIIEKSDKNERTLMFAEFYKEIQLKTDKDVINVNVIDKDSMLKLYSEVYPKYIDKIIKKYPQHRAKMLVDDCLNKDHEFLEKCLEGTDYDERTRLVFYAYVEGIIDARDLRGYTSRYSINKDNIINNLIFFKKSNPEIDLVGLFREGYVTQNILLRLYRAKCIDAKMISEFNKMCETNEIEFENNKLVPDISEYLKSYMILNRRKILKTLISKNDWSQKDINNFLKKHPYLQNEPSHQELYFAESEFSLQSELISPFEQLKDKQKSRTVKKIKDELGTAYLSPDILFMLYKDGIVNYETCYTELEGGNEFRKKVELYEQERKGDYSKSLNNERKVISLYHHRKITANDVVKLYCDGKISRDVYEGLKDDGFKSSLSVDEVFEAYTDAISLNNAKDTEYYFERLARYKNEFASLSSDIEQAKLSQKIEEQTQDLSEEVILKLASYGLFFKETLKSSLENDNYDLLKALVTGENKVDATTLKYLFNDEYTVENQSVHKRDLLEYVFLSFENMSNEDKMSLLISIYGGNKNETKEQKDFNYENFHYFITNGYVTNGVSDGRTSGSKKPNDKVVRNSGNATGTSHINKLEFPLIERYDELFSLDEDTIFNYNENSYIFRYPSRNRVIVESLGKVNRDKTIMDDKTNHRTYILSADLFDRNKESFLDNQNGKEVFMFNKFIPWFRDMRKVRQDMKAFNHTLGWAKNVREDFRIKKDTKTETKKPERERVGIGE